MPIIVSLIEEETDFDELHPMIFDSWQNPPNPQLKHFRPSYLNREESIEYGKKRSVNTFRAKNPKTFMLKAVDTDTKKAVGYAQWCVNDNPGHSEPTVATWYPEGSDERKFAEMFINGLWSYMSDRVTRPHMDLLSLVVDPKERRRGIGRLLIRWGLDKADELGIETVVSSLVTAREAYEKCGLGCIELLPANPALNVPYPSEKWKELLSDNLNGWLLWRPVGHDYVAGVDKAPWI